MESLYGCDLGYVQAAAFQDATRRAAGEIVRRLRDAQVKNVMDIGCGIGALTRALVDQGFAVTGVDSSRELLEQARAQVPEAQFLHASAYEVEVCNCEAVLAIGEALAYHAEGARRRKFGSQLLSTRF